MQNKHPPLCQIIGIINVTRDSFSDDGIIKDDSENHNNIEKEAILQAQRFVDAGCDFLDIGGEATRPGYVPVSQSEECRRTIPIIRKLRALFPDITLAIDTSKAQVAKLAIEAGVHIINDVTALQGDKEMGGVIAKAQKSGNPIQVVLMHNSSKHEEITTDSKIGSSYLPHHTALAPEAFFENVIEDFTRLIKNAEDHTIDRHSLILDPGIGFGKSKEQNLILLANAERLKTTFSLPIYIGASRKSFIGSILDRKTNERLFGSIGVAAVAAYKGADYIRVHDVAESIDAVKMATSIAKFSLTDY